jgi:hypothetical protein
MSHCVVQQRRLQARRHSTTYCYDFPAVFQDALLALWAAYEAESGQRPPPAPVMEATELVLDSAAGGPWFSPSDFRTANLSLKEVCPIPLPPSEPLCLSGALT